MSKILFYTVGGGDHGLGHVQRSLTLADELRARGHVVSFGTEASTAGVDRIRAAGYAPMPYDPGVYNWVSSVVDVVIVDIQNGPSIEMLTIIKHLASTAKIVAVGGVGYGLKNKDLDVLVDLEVYQSVLADKSTSARVLSGIEYVMVRPAYAELSGNANGSIVVYAGGGDSALANVIIDKLEKEERPAIRGGALPSLADVLSGASLYVGAMGMSVYEALAAGVPCIVTSLTEDHLRTAEALPVVSLGLMADFDADAMLSAVKAALADWKPAERIVDGQGVKRVADRVLALLGAPKPKNRKVGKVRVKPGGVKVSKADDA